MGKSEIKDLLQAEIQMFQVFAIFLVGLVTGLSSIVLTEEFEDKLVYRILLIVDLTVLIYVIFICSIQMVRIKKLKSKLN